MGTAHAAAGNRDTWKCRALEAVRLDEYGHGFGGGAAPQLASSYRAVALTGPTVHQQVAPWFLQQQQQGTIDVPATDRHALNVTNFGGGGSCLASWVFAKRQPGT